MAMYVPEQEIIGLSGQITTVNNLLDLAGSGANPLDCAPGGVKLNTLSFDITTSGTISGGTITPEISADGVNWKPVFVTQINGVALVTLTLSVSTAGTYLVSTSLRYFRLRLSAAVTGGGSVAARGWLSADSNMPAVLPVVLNNENPIGATSDAAASSDTGTFSLLAFFKRLLSTYLSPLLTRYPADIEITGLSGQINTVNNMLDVAGGGANATDCAPNGTLYAGLIVDVVTSGAVTGGTMFFEWSSDNTNWKVGYNVATNSQANGQGAAASSQGRYYAGIEARYFRLRLSSAVTGGGSVAVRAYLLRQSRIMTEHNVIISNTPFVNSAANNSSTNALSVSKRISTADTNAAVIKSSAGRIYSIFASNNSASWRYLKIYSKATAPTVGTDVPVAVYGIPPGSAMQQNYADIGYYNSLGLVMAITAGIADSDATAIAANEVAVTIMYA